MAVIDYESEYNNRQRVPQYAEFNARWARESEAYRQIAAGRSELDVPYGPGPRHRFDAFHPSSITGNAPILVYIHGGYWQRGDRKEHSRIARCFNERGLSVVLPSYSLAPEISVIDIVRELAGCMVQLWRLSGRRMIVAGHSAGGHLTAAMLAIDWSKVDGVPADLVLGGYAISGVFDLAPLIGTSIDEPLKLTPQTAREASPLFWAAPKGREFVAAAGGNESAEFIRQARRIVADWGQAGVKTECQIIEGADHFTIVDQLTDPASRMVQTLVRMAIAPGG